jgi:bifunctional N-acetylglucosamine-1-phosphate-uridyltransferase/glucosamine-1-phosphate-acetyltransferase GlmU-like protein
MQLRTIDTDCPPDGISLVVPAAGMATRMGHRLPKALIETSRGRLIEISTSNLIQYAKEIIVVVSPHQQEQFQSLVRSLGNIAPKFAIQEIPRGTADAVAIGLRSVTSPVSVVVWADHLGARYFDLRFVWSLIRGNSWDILVPVVYRNSPYAYFSISPNGTISNFHETRHGAQEVQNGWSDCGVFIARTEVLRNAFLKSDSSDSTDVNFLSLFTRFQELGLNVQTIRLDDTRLTLGANTQSEIEDFLQVT